MDIFSVLTLLGGLAFFLYGMNVLSSGLERMAGGKLEGILKKMTSNRFKSLALGAIITAVRIRQAALTQKYSLAFLFILCPPSVCHWFMDIEYQTTRLPSIDLINKLNRFLWDKRIKPFVF